MKIFRLYAFTIFTILCLATNAGHASTTDRHRKVLIVYSFDDLLPWQAGIRSGLQERLDDIDPGQRPDIYEERIDFARIDFAISEPAFTTYLRTKYATSRFDTVIAESSAATRFLLDHPELFAEATRYAIDPIGSEPTDLPDSGIHVIATQGDWARTSLATVAGVMPQATRLIAVVDHSPVGETNRRSLLAAASTLPKAASLEVWDDFGFDDLYRKAARLPPGSAILYSPVFQDRNGLRQTPRVVARDLAAAASVPVFAHHDTFLGTGVVGGRMLSARLEGKMIADLALGSSRGRGEVSLDVALNPYVFDEAALERWNISTDRLPASSLVTRRAEPLWHQYRLEIGLTFAAILAEALLILWLITALKQRKAAIVAVVHERDGLERRIAERTADLLATTRRLEETNMCLEKLAGTDALTAVANRRKFLDLAETEVRRAQSQATPLSFLMLDIDRFKSINDRYGHALGDQVIRVTAEACQTCIGPDDCLGRMGGEEFAILLPGLGAWDAVARAERIREVAGSLNIQTEAGTVTITVSIGVGTLTGPYDTLSDLMERADAGLYRAKNQGRDRVVSTTQPHGATEPALHAAGR